MGNLHSASGMTAYRKLGKAGRAELRKRGNTSTARAVCADCGGKAAVKTTRDGKVVNLCAACKMGEPRCAFCGMRASTRRPLALFRQADGAFMPACNICAKLRKQPERLALPAPRLNEYIRPIRRELRKLIGNVPRQIPSGQVIALGPGSWNSPYDPPAMARAREQIKQELEKLTWLRENKQPGKAAWQGICNASWEIRSAEQRVQALQVQLHFLEKAA